MTFKKIKPILLRLLAAVGLYVLYAMFANLSLIAMRTSWLLPYVIDFWNDQKFCAAAFLYSLVVLFSLFSIFTLHDASYRARFFEWRTSEPHFFKKCQFILSGKEFWIQIGAIHALILFTSTRPTFGPMIDGFFPNQGVLLEKIYSTAIALPLFGVICFAAHMSTVNWWSRYKSNVDPGFHPFKAAWQLVSSGVLYVLAAGVITVIYPAVFGSLYYFVKKYWWLSILLVVLMFVSFWSFIILRILYKRYRMVKRLKAICHIHGYRLILHHGLYAALLSAKDGYDFTVDTGEMQFSCKLIPSLSRKNNLFFHESGIVSYTSSLMDVILHTVSQRYFFEADGKKIIIVNPVSNRLYVCNDHEKRLLETGDVIMGYTIHTASGFLGALDRNCL